MAEFSKGRRPRDQKAIRSTLAARFAGSAVDGSPFKVAITGGVLRSRTHPISFANHPYCLYVGGGVDMRWGLMQTVTIRDASVSEMSRSSTMSGSDDGCVVGDSELVRVERDGDESFGAVGQAGEGDSRSLDALTAQHCGADPALDKNGTRCRSQPKLAAMCEP